MSSEENYHRVRADNTNAGSRFGFLLSIMLVASVAVVVVVGASFAIIRYQQAHDPAYFGAEQLCRSAGHGDSDAYVRCFHAEVLKTPLDRALLLSRWSLIPLGVAILAGLLATHEVRREGRLNQGADARALRARLFLSGAVIIAGVVLIAVVWVAGAILSNSVSGNSQRPG